MVSVSDKEIRALLKKGYSASKIARELHIRKSVALHRVRAITGVKKQKSKATVKGKGSQKKARAKALEKRHGKHIEESSKILHPRTQIRVLIDLEKPVIYSGRSSADKINVLDKNISSRSDITDIQQKIRGYRKEGNTVKVTYRDMATHEKISLRKVYSLFPKGK